MVATTTPSVGASTKTPRARSMSGNFRNSAGSNALQRPQTSLRQSRVSSFRATTSQPQYDFLSGAEGQNNQYARPSSRQGRSESMRASSHESSKENMAPPDAEGYEAQRKRIEELKAENATLHFTFNSEKQEMEIKWLQQDNTIRELQRKADDEYKQRQVADAEKSKAQRQYDALQNDLDELRETTTRDKLALEKRARESADEARVAIDQLEDLTAAKDESERLSMKKLSDLQAQISNLRQTVEELEKDGQAREMTLLQAQEQLTAKDKVVGALEADVLRLKAQTGDAETVAVIRRELTDQVQHIRSLEAKTTKQHAELTHLRQTYKSVEVVEEQKRSLQRKLEAAQTLEAELVEERNQRHRLEDERLAWSAYFDNPGEFDSPGAVARALVQERFNSASLTEKLGEVQPQIAERDEIIKSLEAEKSSLNSQLEKLKSNGAPVVADKTRARAERQRVLADKQIEYLQAQLKTFDAEDETFEPEKVDQQRAERISQLEQLVDQYRAEIQNLHTELSSIETASRGGVPQTAVGNKRKSDEDPESEQIGELNRKRRKLADELSKTQNKLQVALKENSVLQSQLHAAQSQNKTRVLSLRSNPTSDWEAIKVATMQALKEENKQLLSQLQRANRNPPFPVIPASQLSAAKREVEEAQKETASAQKSARRLKEVWANKSQEFKEAIFSTLGWTVTFIPNGKMRVESLFYPSMTDEHENSIVFDGERGTMKVSGGPQSEFAKKIGDQIQFWVREKGCIPGFLAALTLEFHEETSGSGAAKS